MTRYIVQRLLLFVPTIFLVSFLAFGIMRILPGDPAVAMLGGFGETGGEGSYSQEDLDALRTEMGLDRALPVQYGVWIWGMVTVDLGDSFFYKLPVTEMLRNRVPTSVELGILAMLLSYVVAIPLGVLSAVKQDTWFDYATKIFTLTGIALPTFWMAILVIFVLARAFDWLPPLAYADFWSDPWTNLQQMVFPALALGYHNMAFAARLTRSSMLEVMREDYIRTARSKGLWEFTVIARHALRNACLPVVTIVGFQLGRLMGGAVLVEAIFLVPGMGSLLVDAVVQRDYPIVQIIILLIAVMVLTLNLIVDLLYGILNPRIRYA
jgi:peptide/nickel transport system permease protein